MYWKIDNKSNSMQHNIIYLKTNHLAMDHAVKLNIKSY